jgi:UDP-glucuronate 4-epimerase
MKILLTGAAGFIGSHLATRLLSRGDEVIGLDNFDETLYARALHERNLTVNAARMRFVEGDLLDAALLDRLASEKPDVIVHLAALAGVRPSIQQPLRYERINVQGTLQLLEACRKHEVKRVVFASSSSVYGARSTVPFREDDPADRPASPYAATKRCGELLCANYSHLYGIATTCLRFFTVYGPRQRPEMAIHKFARLILDGKTVPLFGDGSTARDYTYVDDIIDGVVASIDRCGGGAYAVYNLGGSRTTTLKGLVALLEASLGKPARIEWLPDQPGDVPITFADVSRSERELGYAPRVPIEEGLARFCAWLKEQP